VSMKSIIIIVMSLAFLIITLSVCAEEYELKYKAVDPYLRSFDVSGQGLMAMAEPDEELSAKPELKSRIPVYVTVKLGNGEDKYTLILDESKGTGTGYDVLYVDSNNNEDLTDDSVIPLRIPSNNEMKQFGPIEVMIKYDDIVEPYYFYLEYQKMDTLVLRENSKFLENMYLRFIPGGYFTGTAKIGKSKCKIGAVDFNGNGIFNDTFSVLPNIKYPDGRLYAVGDQVLFTLDANEENMPFYFYPYSKYIELDGKWYSVNVSSDGRMIDVNNADIDLGTIRVPYQLNSLQLVSENGVMTVNGRNILDPKGKITYEYEVPTGIYKLFAYAMETRKSGEEWFCNADGTESVEQFQVKKGEVFDLKFGFPFIMNISCLPLSGQQTNIAAGDTVLLSLTFSGQAGEVFTNITKSGKQLPRPTFKAVDENGNVIAENSFEYG
jgi:hypothetical protein